MLSRLLEGGAAGVRVRRLGGTRAGEIRLTRFLRNEAVGIEEMIEHAGRRTVQRVAGRHVLAIQDTTAVRPQKGGGGAHLHAVIAVDAQDGTLLGLIDAQFLHHDGGRKVLRRQRPVEHKESFRWLQGADQAATVCAGAASVTVIADREGDIYEAFALRPEGTELLIRAAQDRSLEDGGRLFAALDAQPVAGQVRIDLPAGPGHRARTARLAVRFATLALACPQRGGVEGLAATVRVQAVDIREIDPPAGAPAVHWRLLTTHAVDSLAEAVTVADLYRRRWVIEQLFRTLKTKGFDVEALRIADHAPRERLLTATLIAAVTIQQMVHARDGGPGPLRPCTDVFDPEDTPLLEAYCARLEGKTERQKNPHPPGSLAHATWVCARLGGWTGYYGKPGPIVILNGYIQFQTAKRALNLLTTHNV